jgi:hypothetical protein
MSATPDLGDYLDVVTRVWQEPLNAPTGKPVHPTSRIRRVLAVSVVTSDDAAQRLGYGAGVVGTVTNDGRFLPDQGGAVVFHADDLPGDSPGYRMLEQVASANDAHLVPVSEFVRRWVRWFCVPRMNPGGRVAGDATLVMFDAPFVLSRLAVKTGKEWTANRGGGFTLDLVPLFGCKSGPHLDKLMPRVRVKHESAHYAQLDWMKYEPPGASRGARIPPDLWRDLVQNRLLDLRSLVSGLAGETIDFEHACGLYEIECGRGEGAVSTLADGYAAGQLAAATLTEFYSLPLRSDDGRFVQTPCRIWSQATVAKATYRAMGIVPPMLRPGWDRSNELMGIALQAYFGARVETKIRATPVPVAVCDFSALYPSVSALVGVWDIVVAEHLDRVEATADVQAFLDSVTEAKLLDPATWRQLAGFVLIEPDGSGALPVRARYSDEPEYTVGLNYYRGAGPQWFTIADVAASVLLTGHVPHVLRAVRLVPSGRLGGLSPLKFGDFTIDPASADFWRTVVEMRKTLGRGHADSCRCEECRTARFLKLMINSGCYGVFAELNREDTDRAGPRVLHDGHGHRKVKSRLNEKPGTFCYPPLASVITGAGRLILALLEHLVVNAGGTHATGDTDSLHIVADATAGTMPCPTPDSTDTINVLSFADVDRIRDRVNRLNPYNRDVVPDLLKREVPAESDTTWCYSISPKRYVLYRLIDGKPVVCPELDGKEATKKHGLGAYVSPADGWINEAWQWILERHYGGRPDWPSWSDAYALAKYQVTTPGMLRLFAAYNAVVPECDQIRPFTKIVVAITSEYDDEIGLDQRTSKYMAPAKLTPGELAGPVWTDRDNPGQLVRLPDPTTMRQVLLRHIRRSDPKLTGPRAGLQERRVVGVLGKVQPIGKEASSLAEAITFRDSAARTTYWPREQTADALIVFDGKPAEEVARLVNEESSAIRTMIERERRAQLNRGGNLRSSARRRELADAADEAERDVITAYGVPVTVSADSVKRLRRGLTIDRDTQTAIERTAAKLAAERLGTNPAKIRQTGANVKAGIHAPAAILSAHRHTVTPRTCPCGCTAVLTGKQAYATTACRQRAHRQRQRHQQAG